ncbi:MAG: hypothetical protein WA194_08085 [Patescibacteria group bacterium]
MEQKTVPNAGIMIRLKDRFEKIHRPHFRNSRYWFDVLSGIAFLSCALILNFYAGQYATSSESNSVTDVILSHTRAHDVDGIFTYGAVLFVCYIAFLCFWHP